MIDFGLSDEYLSGYAARLKGEPFDANKSDDYKMGWANAHQALNRKGMVPERRSADIT